MIGSSTELLDMETESRDECECVGLLPPIEPD